MAIFVLVHGGNMSTDTWNQLSGQDINTPTGYMGASYWDGTVEFLRNHGHIVFKPKLIDEHHGNLTDHILQICDMIKEEKLEDIILVGHSYGGFVITGVADRHPELIHLLIYLDSAIPDPGQSLFDVLETTNSYGNYETALPDPSPPYIEKLFYNPETLKKVIKVYIRCTKSEFIDLNTLVKQKIEKSGEGWIYYELPSSHVPMADMPDEFNLLMIKLTKY